MIKLFVVGLGYLMVLAMELSSFTASEYYSLLTVTCFLLISLCIASEDKILIAYATLQLTVCFFYICMIYPTNMWAENLLYGNQVNISIMVFIFELIIILLGLRDVFRAFNFRRFGFRGVSYQSNNSNLEA